MVALFRLITADTIRFYDMPLCLKLFDSKQLGWEERDASVDHPLLDQEVMSDTFADSRSIRNVPSE
jgi:hypothetical protein